LEGLSGGIVSKVEEKKSKGNARRENEIRIWEGGSDNRGPRKTRENVAKKVMNSRQNQNGHERS